MSSHHPLNFTAGFSLIEMMIVLGVTSVIALGVAEMMTRQAQQQRNLRIKANITQLQTNLQLLTADPAALYETAKLQNPTSSNGNSGSGGSTSGGGNGGTTGQAAPNNTTSAL